MVWILNRYLLLSTIAHICNSMIVFLFASNYCFSITRLGQCKYQHGDCVEILTKETEDKLADSCVGLPHCGITVSVAWMSRCRAYSSYNYALYKCIPSEPILAKYLVLYHHYISLMHGENKH